MADLGSLLGSAGIGGAIGKAIVSLELDTKKYQAELKGAQAQTVAVRTNASSQAFGSFSGFASKALLGVGVAAVAGAAVSVKAAIEANEAHLKLQNTFENNAKLSDSSVEAFEAQAEALQLLTGESDEAIITSQALLGQFEITGSQVQELIPLVVDLATKMGIDMTAAAKSVGKAVIGNTAGLQRYGIVIEEASGKGGEFDAVLKGLSGTVEGFAKQRAIDEPWRVLSARFDEVAEDIGRILLPLLQDLTELLGNLVPVLEAVAQAIRDAFSAETYTDIPIIGEAFKALGVGIQAVADATNTTGEEIRRNGMPLLKEMQQTADLAASGITNLGDSVTVATDAIAAADVALLDGAKSFQRLGKAAKAIQEELVAEIPGIIGTVTTYKETFTLSPGELKKIAESWARIARTIAHDLREIGKADLTPAVREAISALPPEMRHAWVEGNAKQRGAIEKSIKDTLNVQKTIPDLAKQALTGGAEVGRSLDQGLVKGIIEGSPAVRNAATRVIDEAIAAAKKAAAAESPSKKMARARCGHDGRSRERHLRRRTEGDRRGEAGDGEDDRRGLLGAGEGQV